MTTGLPAPPIDVSVIVPFHDAERHLDECIRALLDQDFPADRYEILLVDNNSNDGSRAIVARYPGVRLLSESRIGAYAARNHAVVESRGSVIAFTDADCAPGRTWLSQMVACLRDPHVDLVLGRPLPSGSRLLNLVEAYESERTAYVFASGVQARYYGYTNNMAVHRAVFDAVGPFHGLGRGADMIFVHQTAERGLIGAVRYVPEACVRHLEMTSAWVWIRKMFTYGGAPTTIAHSSGRAR